MSFKDLKIRAYLQTPIISDKLLPLDGVLYFQKCRLLLGEQEITKPNESVIREVYGIGLPIKKGGKTDESWFYHCSSAIWADDMVEGKAFKVKQGDWVRFPEYLESKTKKIDVARGKFKAYQISLFYRSASYVEWYCVGNKEEIAILLSFCTNLGKNAGDGWGSVLRWEIEEVDADYSIRKDGKLMRPVPVMDRTAPLYGIRPSYWNPKHIFNCKLPE